MIAVFWNNQQRRLRTLWRMVLAGGIFALNLALGALGTAAFSAWVIAQPAQQAPEHSTAQPRGPSPAY